MYSNVLLMSAGAILPTCHNSKHAYYSIFRRKRKGHTDDPSIEIILHTILLLLLYYTHHIIINTEHYGSPLGLKGIPDLLDSFAMIMCIKTHNNQKKKK